MKYKIVDNALTLPEANLIKTTMSGGQFPWYYSPDITYSKEDKKITNEMVKVGYFTHMFYNNYSISSNDYEKIWPIIKIINPKALIRIKGNLYLNRYNGNVNKHPSHVDYDFPHLGAIYYVNTNDGATILEDGTKVDSVFNRLLIFDASKPHSSTDCSDADYRMNINFNFYL